MVNSENDSENSLMFGQGIGAIPSGDFLSKAFEKEPEPDNASQSLNNEIIDQSESNFIEVPEGMSDLPHACALAAWQIEYAVSHLPFGQSSRLFALVPSRQILADSQEDQEESDSDVLEQLQMVLSKNPDHLSAIEQVHIPPALVDQALEHAAFPPEIFGVGISSERISVPTENIDVDKLTNDEIQDLVKNATQENMTRVVVTADRDGNSWCIIHPAMAESLKDISQGEDLIPYMVTKLRDILSRPVPESSDEQEEQDEQNEQ